MSVTAKNPILSGFYPDPSICAVGEDFYIVNSTFAYFPGLPIMHSKDLAHWEQIGNALDRESQLPLAQAGHSQGLFAPTIRYFEGTFYIICTNVSYGGNFIVTAKNPAGPWSEPHYIKGADGIDPSLFFDDDGTCYYIGTHPNPDGCKYDGDWYIWIQQLDLERMELTGEAHNVWNGAMKQIIWPEGPHLYKKDGYYYIMNAEGGTGPDHAVTVCRSQNIFGPYQNNFCNPILTHRHLGKDYPIKYVGHADLVQTVNDEWYMVMLGVRPIEGYTTMGRETFLAKVVWENGWPVVNPGIGMLTDEVEIDLPEWQTENAIDEYYDFTTANQVDAAFLRLRNPIDKDYRIEAGKGLILDFSKYSLKEKESPSFIAVRQKHHNFISNTKLLTEGLTDKTKAGMVYMQSNEAHLRAEAGKGEVQIILCENGKDNLVENIIIDDAHPITMELRVHGLTAEFKINENISKHIDIRGLSTEAAGGFVGCTVGIYAWKDMSADLKTDTQGACFTEFSYKEA